VRDYRQYSFWLDDVPGGLTPRPALEGPADVDVAIVGAGFTGLWTAYYLAKADPHLRIAVVEKDIAGFGASGRNGGWVSPFFATPLAALAKSHGHDAAVRMQREMFTTVDEIGRACADEGIDARFHKGGLLWVSTSPAQTPRVREVLNGRWPSAVPRRTGRGSGAGKCSSVCASRAASAASTARAMRASTRRAWRAGSRTP